MSIDSSIFRGCIPAVMTPCFSDGRPDFLELVRSSVELIDAGMSAVVYCGSMGEWPLLSDEDRRHGVRLLVDAGVPVIVGTGAINTAVAAAHANHAQQVGAKGLMIIPRLLSRGTSPAAQRQHFARVLTAAPDLPAVIYNSPYYGFETKAELFFDLRRQYANLVGFKEFGGANSLSYAAEFIAHAPDVVLMAGVDTQVFHGFVNCGAKGAITGIGNCLPRAVLRLVELCEQAARGDVRARGLAFQLSEALKVLSTFDEGPDLVLYYKFLMVLAGNPAYQYSVDPSDELGESQKAFAECQWELFRNWWDCWEGR